MSVLGPSGMGAWNLPASAAGSQRNPAAADRAQAEQATQKRHADQVQLTTRDIDDSVETEFSHGQVGDRDADGRDWTFQERPEQEEAPAEDESAKKKLPDESDRGQTLDLDA